MTTVFNTHDNFFTPLNISKRLYDVRVNGLGAQKGLSPERSESNFTPLDSSYINESDPNKIIIIQK